MKSLPIALLVTILLLSSGINLYSDNDVWRNYDGIGPGPRVGHTLTELDGTIYLLGGQLVGENGDGIGEFNDLWAYDEDKQWAQEEILTTLLPQPRTEHIAAAANYNLYTFGGRNEKGFECSNNIWQYDPATKEWFAPNVPGNAPPTRTSSCMISINGKIYMYGGQTSGIILNDLWYYNPTSNSWNNRTSSSVKSSYGHTAGVLNGKMYVFGGHNGEKPNNDFKFYNPFNGLWTNIEIEKFEKSNDKHVFESTAPSPRFNHCAVSDSSRLWIFGGTDEEGNDLAETWMFDPETEKWYRMTDGPAFT